MLIIIISTTIRTGALFLNFSFVFVGNVFGSIQRKLQPIHFCWTAVYKVVFIVSFPFFSEFYSKIVPMRNFRFRTFVRSGKNRNIINHEVVQKVVTRKIREPL